MTKNDRKNPRRRKAKPEISLSEIISMAIAENKLRAFPRGEKVIIEIYGVKFETTREEMRASMQHMIRKTGKTPLDIIVEIMKDGSDPETSKEAAELYWDVCDAPEMGGRTDYPNSIQ